MIYFIGDVRLSSAPVKNIIWEHRTKYGDGKFYDQHGNQYIVDYGVLGLAESDIETSGEFYQKPYINQHGVEIGLLINIDKDLECHYNDGEFWIGDILIQTNTKFYKEIGEQLFGDLEE